MLRGSVIAKADGKGRLKLPSVFRAAIEPKYGTDFFVTSLRGESVRIYPLQVWLKVEERLAQAPSLNPTVMRFKKSSSYFGQTVTMDTQGRILIHPMLRDKAAIRGEVAILGQHDYLEVWNRAAFEEQLEAEPLTDRDLEILAEFGI